MHQYRAAYTAGEAPVKSNSGGKKLNKIEMSVCVVKRPQETSSEHEFLLSGSLASLRIAERQCREF